MEESHKKKKNAISLALIIEEGDHKPRNMELEKEKKIDSFLELLEEMQPC